MGLFGGSKSDKAFREYEMPKEPSFWQGGNKFRGRDGIAALLAAIGDGLSQASGGQAWATRNLAGGRFDAMEEAKKRAKEQEKLQQMMAVGSRLGMTPEQVQAQAIGLNVPQPDEFTRMADRAGLTPEERTQAARRKAMGDPFLTGAPLPSGGQYYGYASGLPGVLGQSAPSGLTPMTPDEIRRMGLPEGGPGGQRPGGFRPRR